MAITFVGSNSGQEAANTTGITLTLPTHAADDFGIIYARADESGTVPVLSIGSATGWTLLRNDNPIDGRDRVEYGWYKKFTSGSETNPVVNIDTAQEHSASVHVFRGVDTTTPFDVAEQVNSGSNDTTPVNPAITPVTANGCLILFHGATHDDISVAGVPTTPSGITLGETILGGTNDHRGQITGYKLDYGSAATITPTAWTHTSSPTNTAEWTVITIVLRPFQDGIKTVTDPFDMDAASVTLTGTDFEASQGNASVYLSDANTLAGSANEVDITSAVNTWSDTSVNLDLTSLSAGELSSLQTLGPGQRYVILVNNSSTEYSAPVLTLHRPEGFEMVTGSIVPGTTTSRLTGLSGTFGGGRAEETAVQNPSTTNTDIADDGNREDVWSIQAKSNAREVQYDFRVLYGGLVAETITQTPQVTVTASGASIALTGLGVTTGLGTFTGNHSLLMNGSEISLGQGVLVSSSGNETALTGQNFTASTGTLLSDSSITLSGLDLTVSPGTLVVPVASIQLIGQAISVSQGTFYGSWNAKKVHTSAGTTLRITASSPATYDVTGYAALTYTAVGEVTDVNELGREYALVSHSTLVTSGTVKKEGSFNEGAISLELELDTDDEGQILAKAASFSDNNYSFEVTTQNGDIYYFQAQVMSFKVGINLVDDITSASINLELTTNSNGIGITESLAV